jgi:hypothetical protein
MNSESRRIAANGCGGGHYPPPTWAGFIVALGIGAFVLLCWGLAALTGT